MSSLLGIYFSESREYPLSTVSLALSVVVIGFFTSLLAYKHVPHFVFWVSGGHVADVGWTVGWSEGWVSLAVLFPVALPLGVLLKEGYYKLMVGEVYFKPFHAFLLRNLLELKFMETVLEENILMQ